MPQRRNAFLKWLLSAPGDGIVGYRVDSCMCPLAMFLSTRGVLMFPTVTFIDSESQWFWRGQQQSMPKWAREVVAAADSTSRETSFITARVLKQILRNRFGWVTT